MALKLFSLIWEEENDKGHLFFLHMEMFGVYIYITTIQMGVEMQNAANIYEENLWKSLDLG